MLKQLKNILLPTAIIIVLSVGGVFILDSWGEEIELERTLSVNGEDVLTFIWAVERFHEKLDQEEIVAEVNELALKIPNGEAGDKWTEVAITNGLLKAKGLGNNMGWIAAINEPTSEIRKNIKLESDHLKDCYISLQVAWDRMYKMDDTPVASEYCEKALSSLSLWLEQREQNIDAIAQLRAEVEAFNAVGD